MTFPWHLEQARNRGPDSVVEAVCDFSACVLGVVGNLVVNLAVRFLQDEVAAFAHERARAFFLMRSATRLSFSFQYSSVSSMRPPRSMAFKSFASVSAVSCASRISWR